MWSGHNPMCRTKYSTPLGARGLKREFRPLKINEGPKLSKVSKAAIMIDSPN